MRDKVSQVSLFRGKRLHEGSELGVVIEALQLWIEDYYLGSPAVRKAAMEDFEAAADSPESVPIIESISICTGIRAAEVLCLLKKTAQKKREEVEAIRGKRTELANANPTDPAQKGSLRWWREEAGFNPVQLAQLAGINEQSLSKIELGRSTPRPETAKKLCAALNLKVEDILEFAGLQAETILKAA